MLNDNMIIKIVSLNYYYTSEDDVKITGVCWMKKKPFFNIQQALRIFIYDRWKKNYSKMLSHFN